LLKKRRELGDRELRLLDVVPVVEADGEDLGRAAHRGLEHDVREP
jgi:hypothetical protein